MALHTSFGDMPGTRISVAQPTVKKYRAQVQEKMNVKNLNELFALWRNEKVALVSPLL